MPPARLTPDQAATVALQALAHIAGDEGLLHRFLDISGLSLAELRERAGDPAMLGGVLDFLLADESALLVFSEMNGVDPALPAQARMALA